MTQLVVPEDLFDVLKKLNERLDRLQRATYPIAIHRVGISTGIDPVSVPFLNSWNNYEPGYASGGSPTAITPGWAPAQFYRDRGRVYISGLVWTSGGTSGTTIFTLPDGYRPYNSHLFAVTGNGGAGRLDVDATGAVINRSSSGLSGTGPGGLQYLNIECSFPHA